MPPDTERLATIRKRCAAAKDGVTRKRDPVTGKMILNPTPNTLEFWVFAKTDMQEVLALLAAAQTQQANDHTLAALARAYVHAHADIRLRRTSSPESWAAWRALVAAVRGERGNDG